MEKQPIFREWKEIKKLQHRISPNGTSGPVKHVVLDGDDVMWHIDPYGLASVCRPVGKTEGNELPCVPGGSWAHQKGKAKSKAKAKPPGTVYLEATLRELLDELKSRDIGVSVASQNDPPSVNQMLEAFGLKDRFDQVQAGWTGKDDMVRAIAEKAGLKAQNILFVDDSEYNVMEVQNTGARGLTYNKVIHRLIDALRYLNE